MSSKNSILLAIGLLICLGCNNPADTNIKDSRIEYNDSLVKRLTEDLKVVDYKTSVKCNRDTVYIDVSVKTSDCESHFFTDILRERIIHCIYGDLRKNYKVKITDVVIDHPEKIRVEHDVYDSTAIRRILYVNYNYRILLDFKNYIYQNIRREKLAGFNFMVKELIKNGDKTLEYPMKENDFILLVLSFGSDCIGINKHEFYRNMLLTIKEAASDKRVWKDFNPKDIDYFLNYCDSVHGNTPSSNNKVVNM